VQTSLSQSICRAFLCCQVEEAVDELNLAKKIVSCQPSNLPLPDHVDGFVALNRSPRRLEFSEALLGSPGPFTLQPNCLLKGGSRKSRLGASSPNQRLRRRKDGQLNPETSESSNPRQFATLTDSCAELRKQWLLR
jgi:hypothetical protein